jgi:hypothetical protein
MDKNRSCLYMNAPRVYSLLTINVKCKSRHITGHESPEGKQRYSSTLSLASALDGVGAQRHVPAALPPGNTRYPLHRRLDGSQGRSGWARKISPPPGFDPPNVQPKASRYTDWPIPAPPCNDPDANSYKKKIKHISWFSSVFMRRFTILLHVSALFWANIRHFYCV